MVSCRFSLSRQPIDHHKSGSSDLAENRISSASQMLQGRLRGALNSTRSMEMAPASVTSGVEWSAAENSWGIFRDKVGELSRAWNMFPGNGPNSNSPISWPRKPHHTRFRPPFWTVRLVQWVIGLEILLAMKKWIGQWPLEFRLGPLIWVFPLEVEWWSSNFGTIDLTSMMTGGTINSSIYDHLEMDFPWL